MKKTLLVTTDFFPRVGGVATYWDRVCSSLETENLIVLTNLPQAKHASCSVIYKPLFFKRFWPKWLKGVFTIYRVYKQQKCEQIVVGQILPVGNMVYLLHKLFKIPYIVQIYGMDLMQVRQHPRKRMIAEKVLKEAQHIIVNSYAVGKIVEQFDISSDNYSVVYPIPRALPSLDAEMIYAFKEKHELSEKKIILTIARLVERKGIDKTIEAMKLVCKDYPDAVYIIVGDGPDKQRLQELAGDVQESIQFVGKVSDEERNLWLASCDLFVMPARETTCDVEGFGIVYLEAHQYSKPVIAGNVGGCVEAVRDKETGILVNPENKDQIANAIIRLLDDPEYAQALGVKGKSRLSGDLHWNESISVLKKTL